MAKLTKEQAVQEWKNMWNWIANESEKRDEILIRRDYMSETGAKYINPLCVYVKQNFGTLDCSKCPAAWQWEFGDIRNTQLRKMQIRPSRCETCKSESSTFFDQVCVVDFYRKDMRKIMIGVDKYVLLVRALANAIE